MSVSSQQTGEPTSREVPGSASVGDGSITVELSPRNRAIAGAVTIGMITLASAWLRWPAFTQGGFVSHDVGGILYNAMVLRRGGLPYVDTAEFKAPGTFYLASLLAGPEGRDIAQFQIWANVWALLGLLSLAVFAWRVWGPRAGAVACAIHGLHDAFLDSMDANYVTWATLPQVLAMWAGYEASRRRSTALRRSLLLWGIAGAMAGAAALLKRPAGAVFPVLVVWAIWTGGQGSLKTRLCWRSAAAVVLGCALAHVPIAAHYAIHGELGAFVGGHFFNEWGSRYVGARSASPWAEVREGSAATAFFLGLPVALAGFSLLAGRGRWREYAWLLAWAVMALLATSIGFRFFKGYFLAALPALALMAAAPWGLTGSRCSLSPWWRLAALAPALVLVLRQGWFLETTRDQRSFARDTGARRIADHVVANTDSDDEIWIWGWHLWGVYALADRGSGSRVYKSWGLLTPPNDNTWRRRGSKARFVDGEFADMLLEDLEADPPAYVVLGSTVPHREFEQLTAFLRANYRRDRRVTIGRVQFWQRRN